MKYLLFNAFLMVGFAGGCKKKEEPAPISLIVGTWQFSARQIVPTTSTGKIDPNQPPPPTPFNMTSTYEADGAFTMFTNGVTHTSGVYTIQGNQLTQTVGFDKLTYTMQELTDKRLQTFLSYQYGTAHYAITDYYDR